MRKKIIIVFLLLLIIPGVLYAYSVIKVPIDFLDFQAFHIDMDSEKIAFYVDCKNPSRGKTVDSIILSVVCNSNEEQTFRYRILEPEGIAPNEHHEYISDFSAGELPVQDITAVEIFVSQVAFRDGSAWECNGMQKTAAARVNGNKGTGIFPVRINEALVYEQEMNVFAYDSIHFQIDWSNISEAESIVNVTYKVTAKKADGTVVVDENGNAAAYVSEFYREPSEWVRPISDNGNVTQYIYGSELTKAFRENEAAVYEVSVCRAVTTTGTVWENSDESDFITAIMCGKKGYFFGDDSMNPSIQRVIARIDEESEKYEINLGVPRVFVKDKQYCILRYPDIDIRVELSERNEVISDKVGFIYYSKTQYDNPEEYIQSFHHKTERLRLCICTSVLTGLPYEEVKQKVSEYNNNDKDYIDFEDLSYDTFEEWVNILDEKNELVNCCVFACGKDLYYPPDKLLWVRESPYEVQQNLEVQHRQ